jgi:hypothetical protein
MPVVISDSLFVLVVGMPAKSPQLMKQHLISRRNLIDNNPGQHGAKNSAERFEVLHSTSTVVEGHADMNPPRLIRPLRPFLQGQLVRTMSAFS